MSEQRRAEMKRLITITSIALAALVLFSAIGIAINCMRRSDLADTAEAGQSVVAEADSIVSWSGTMKDTTPDKEGIKIPGFGKVYFQANETVVPITLSNPESNKCLFKYEMYVDDSDTPIYCSDYISPGKAIRKITLSDRISKGNHKLKIIVNTFDNESLAELNNSVVTTDLTVM